MKRYWLAAAFAIAPSLAAAQAPSPPPETGPFARIAFLRPHDGDTVDFEAGYIRHLDFHRRADDAWRWFGWTVWAGERQRFFVYATFGHSAASLDRPVTPAEDERDNVANVTPHAEFTGNGLYEFLPALSRGGEEPSALPRLELVTVDVVPGSEKAFEAALAAQAAGLRDETLWYRMIAGGPAPRYVRLRARAGIASLIDARAEGALPAAAQPHVRKASVEVLSFRPVLSYGVMPPG
jgi:hypothetical protein